MPADQGLALLIIQQIRHQQALAVASVQGGHPLQNEHLVDIRIDALHRTGQLHKAHIRQGFGRLQRADGGSHRFPLGHSQHTAVGENAVEIGCAHAAHAVELLPGAGVFSVGHQNLLHSEALCQAHLQTDMVFKGRADDDFNDPQSTGLLQHAGDVGPGQKHLFGDLLLRQSLFIVHLGNRQKLLHISHYITSPGCSSSLIAYSFIIAKKRKNIKCKFRLKEFRSQDNISHLAYGYFVSH